MAVDSECLRGALSRGREDLRAHQPAPQDGRPELGRGLQCYVVDEAVVRARERLPALHLEVEKNLGFELPATPYLALHWQQLRALLAGHTESDLCDAHEAELVVQGRLTRIPPFGD